MIPARKHITLAAAAIAGAALTSTAFGQNLANNRADFDERNLPAHLAAVCARYTDPASNTQCYYNEARKWHQARGAAATQHANQVVASEQELQRCTAFLRQKRDSGTVFDRTITRENVCPYARELGMRDGPG